MRLTWQGWERTLLEIFDIYQWRVAHNRPARRKDGSWMQPVAGNAGTGFPDFVAHRGPRLVFAEAKLDKARVQKEQREWIDGLREAGQEVYVFRPQDVDGIHRLLARQQWERPTDEQVRNAISGD